MLLKAGNLDRRITVQVATETKDRAGDTLLEWPEALEPVVAPSYKRWAERIDVTSREINESDNQLALREGGVVWRVRWDSKTSIIAPEKMRIIYRRQIYEIIGVLLLGDREDGVKVSTVVRPDQRGAAGPVNANT